jgi:hypothetical protein
MPGKRYARHTSGNSATLAARRSKRRWWNQRVRQLLDKLEDGDEDEIRHEYVPPSKRGKSRKEETSSSSDESECDAVDQVAETPGFSNEETESQPSQDLDFPIPSAAFLSPALLPATDVYVPPELSPVREETFQEGDTSFDPSADPLLEEDEDQVEEAYQGFLQNLREAQNEGENYVEPIEDQDTDQSAELDVGQALGKVARKAEAVRPIREFFASLKASNQVSHGAILKIYDFIKSHAQEIAESEKNGLLPSMRTLRRQTKKHLPQTLVTYTYLDNDVEKTVHGAATLPRWLALDRMKLLRVRASIDLQELFNFYKRLHPEWGDKDLASQTLELSADGVTESNSGQHRFYIISLAFSSCKAPLPWHVWEFRSQTGPTLQELFEDLVKEINQAGVQVSLIVVDGKEQNYIRGMVTTNGYYGCARCLTCGTTKKLKKVHYPYNMINPEPKTHQLFVHLLETHPEMFVVPDATTRHTRVGIEQRSPLLDLHNFDIVQDIPLDPVHLLHLGITKKTWDRMFETDVLWKTGTRNRVKARFNLRLMDVKVPSEITRKMYGVTPSKMKASQWQIIDMFCLPTLALEVTAAKELQQVLLLYTFIVRLVYGSNHNFQKVKSQLNLQHTINTFYKLYSKVFGVGAFTFNLHSFYHIFESRERNGPVWTHSTGKYESLYAVTRRCYDGRTFNTPLQLLENFHSAAATAHRCNLKRNITLADKATKKTDDTLIYCRDGLYKIEKVVEDGLKVRKLIVSPLDTQGIIQLPWAFVGVFKLLNTEKDCSYIQKDDVVAKAILCNDIVSTCYTEWLLT